MGCPTLALISLAVVEVLLVSAKILPPQLSTVYQISLNL